MHMKGIKRTFYLLILMLAIAVLVYGCHLGAPAYKGPRSQHFDGKQFHNLAPYSKKSFWDILKWRVSRKDPRWPEWVENKKYSDPDKRFNHRGKVAVTFINHATVLLQIDGVNILTDPHWSQRASPVSWTGPKRIRSPGVSFDKLPKIDIVLISHNHYDHMDLDTLLKLRKKFHPVFIVGLGNDLYLKKHGIRHAKALDWWQSTTIKGLKIFFVPAQHFSSRGLTDRMTNLWGGFVIQGSPGPIYFAGDTAMAPHFQQIEKKFGPIYFAMLPIGAYEPRNIMKSSHINPAEAVQAFIILKAKYAIGIHFDTFSGLTDEPFGDAAKKLQTALSRSKIAKGLFRVLGFGQHCVLGKSFICVSARK